MARIVEIAVAMSAICGVATFLGFRAAFRKFLRTMGRQPGKEPSKQIEERRTDGT
jgi:hypothetical protein